MKRKITFFQNFHWDFTTSCFIRRQIIWRGCLFRSSCFFFSLLTYFVISWLKRSFSCFLTTRGKRLKTNMKIKFRCFKALLWTKKKIITTPLTFVFYEFERSATPMIGISISTTSDRIKRWTFYKYSRERTWSQYLF